MQFVRMLLLSTVSLVCWVQVYAASENPVSVSKDEKRIVESRIVTLQKFLINGLDFLKKDSFVREGTWELTLRVRDDFWKIRGESEEMSVRWKILNQYTIEVSEGEDFHFSWKITGNISMKVDDYVKIYTGNLSTQYSFIRKDGDFYVGLKDLLFSGNFFNELFDAFPAFKNIREFFSSNSYIQIGGWDEEEKATIERSKKILWDIHTLLQTRSVFVPYKKVWEKYILVPSKRVCDILISLDNQRKTWCTKREYGELVSFFLKGDVRVYFSMTGGTNVFSLEHEEGGIKFQLQYSMYEDTSEIKTWEAYIWVKSDTFWKGKLTLSFEYDRNQKNQKGMMVANNFFWWNGSAQGNEAAFSWIFVLKHKSFPDNHLYLAIATKGKDVIVRFIGYSKEKKQVFLHWNTKFLNVFEKDASGLGWVPFNSSFVFYFWDYAFNVEANSLFEKLTEKDYSYKTNVTLRVIEKNLEEEILSFSFVDVWKHVSKIVEILAPKNYTGFKDFIEFLREKEISRIRSFY